MQSVQARALAHSVTRLLPRVRLNLQMHPQVHLLPSRWQHQAPDFQLLELQAKKTFMLL